MAAPAAWRSRNRRGERQLRASPAATLRRRSAAARAPNESSRGANVPCSKPIADR
jgi:hypothetical protein